MRVFINIVKGFSAVRKSAWMVLLLFVINFLFSLILAVPMYTTLKDSFGKSEVGDRMAKGFDYIWWEEFRDQSRGIESTFSPSIIGKGAVLDNFVNLINLGASSLPVTILVFGLFYILLHTFLSGGILTVLKEANPHFSMTGFFSGSGKYFTRFILLTLLSWIFFVCVIALRGFFFTGIDKISETARSEITPFFLGLASSVFTYVLFLFFQMVFDYARIKTVLQDRQNVLRSTIDAFGFVFKHPLSTLGLFYLLLLANLITTVFYLLFKEILPQSSMVGVAVSFLIQQAFIFAIIWIRCWVYSSQLELHRYLK